MCGAAWNPKKKTPEEEWHEEVIMKNEYYDILTTEECLKDKITQDKEGMSAEMVGCTGLLNQLRGIL